VFSEADTKPLPSILQEMLAKIVVGCPIHADDGCDWKGAYREAPQHVAEGCGKALVSCPYGCAGVRLPRERLPEHDRDAAVAHSRVLNERLESEARERRQLHRSMLALTDRLLGVRAQLALEQQERAAEQLAAAQRVQALQDLVAAEARTRQVRGCCVGA
jgi:hypothetical protein